METVRPTGSEDGPDSYRTNGTSSIDEIEPFRQSALTYYRKGWIDTFPIGTRNGPRFAKAPVPTGVIGYDAPAVGFKRIHATVYAPAGRRNIGIRMPMQVVCLDVDEYGDHHGLETLAKAEADLGPLPATYRNSARGLTPSGHRYYRCPLGRVAKPGAEELLAAAYGPNVEVLHRGRRYAVAWPSLNPSAGFAPYLWYGPDGTVLTEPPAVVELPVFPERWADFMTAPIGSPESQRQGGNLRAPRSGEAQDGGDLFDGVGQAWRRSVMEAKTREHLTAVLRMKVGTVNKTLGSAGIAYARYANAGLFTLEQARKLLEAAARKNGVHSDAWNRANRKKWTLDSRLTDALSQGLGREPIQIIDDFPATDVYGQLMREIIR